ncbi:MAG: hypothetical protein HOW97_26770 [Catenulispora sp.]|nr:hypothetical protein [Catenulispora sp.]
MSGQSAEVYRIDWVPGSDLLHGVCHCGAEHLASDPIAMWEWMLAHPLGHEGSQGIQGSSQQSSTEISPQITAGESSSDGRHA